jgi:cation diffusion facilitator CzcD-associated flavoprotein CzcO
MESVSPADPSFDIGDGYRFLTEKFSFNPIALQQRYRVERARRLRPEGNDQYRRIAGEFTHYLDDPHADPNFRRAPLLDEVEVVVIGGGFGGLLAAARLREAGMTDVRIIDRAGDFGGTWYWNRYPGAACDVESYVYMPLLEETGYIPTKKYAEGPEILAYSQAIARHYDLYRNACFQTEVTEARWDEAAARWVVRTDRNDVMRARYVVMSSGPMHRPKLPGIVGIEQFKGRAFHTSRWDYRYTGGDVSGGLTGLKDKVVGVIGTGATAVQCIPHIAADAKHLYVFQRTPSSINFRGNSLTDSEWVRTLQPGWQQQRMDNFNTIISGGLVDVDLVNDSWTHIISELRLTSHRSEIDLTKLPPDKMVKLMQLVDFQKMEIARQRVDAVVRDPATAAALKPWYYFFCKRPCFHDEYLETFNRDNVTLVDTNGRGVESVTEHAVIANERKYEVDCLVFATGFETSTAHTVRSGLELRGRGDRTLAEKWAGGMSTLHGMHVHGFPNCFFMMMNQSGFTPNYPHMLNEQAKHLAYITAECVRRQARTVEATQEAEEAWVQEIMAWAGLKQKMDEECTPGFYNNEGQPQLSARNGPHGKGSIAFVELIQEWRSAGTLAGLLLE